MVREMAENEIKPYVQEADEKGECPRELFDWGFKMGLHMLEIPEEFGGTGLSYETTAMIFEELAKVDAGYAISFVTSFVALRNVILPRTGQILCRHSKTRQVCRLCLNRAKRRFRSRRNACNCRKGRRRLYLKRKQDLYYQRSLSFHYGRLL